MAPELKAKVAWPESGLPLPSRSSSATFATPTYWLVSTPPFCT